MLLSAPDEPTISGSGARFRRGQGVVCQIATDSQISISTGYSYLNEGIHIEPDRTTWRPSVASLFLGMAHWILQCHCKACDKDA
jgi:hypothetical protein